MKHKKTNLPFQISLSLLFLFHLKKNMFFENKYFIHLVKWNVAFKAILSFSVLKWPVDNEYYILYFMLQETITIKLILILIVKIKTNIIQMTFWLLFGRFWMIKTRITTKKRGENWSFFTFQLFFFYYYYFCGYMHSFLIRYT